ncbi:MAG: hypothetical protein RIT81_01100 [Deltaproteobacteria bacterium]
MRVEEILAAHLERLRATRRPLLRTLILIRAFTWPVLFLLFGGIGSCVVAPAELGRVLDRAYDLGIVNLYAALLFFVALLVVKALIQPTEELVSSLRALRRAGCPRQMRALERALEGREPFILYLRGFGRETPRYEAEVKVASWVSGTTEVVRHRRRREPDETLLELLAERRPVLCVGNIGDPQQFEGAMHLYADDTSWPDIVRELIPKAERIVVFANTLSHGVQTEMAPSAGMMNSNGARRRWAKRHSPLYEALRERLTPVLDRHFDNG